MKKSWKKLIVGLFVFALVLSGMNLLLFGESKVQAEETSVKYYVQPYSGEQVSAYKTAKKVPSPTPEAGKEKYNDWIFAGWFTNDACSNALVNTIDAESTYYAKYVPAEVLSVRAQVKKDTVKETDKTDLRLIATVDSLQYKKVGFEIYYAGSSNPVVVNTTTVYERIEAAKDGVDYGFSPNIFDIQSEYFVTATLKNIANKNFGKDFYIKPYWETLDGTTVYGTSRHARVEDSYLGIVNVPVRVVSDATTATTGSVNVTYNTTYFTYADSYQSTLLNDVTTSTPGYVSGEVFDSVTVDGTTTGIVSVTGSAVEAQRINGEVVHLRFKTNSDVTLLKKNVFTVTSSDLTQDIVLTNTVYYDFNNTTYNGVADTSWHDENEEEFVITTPAELYGFASLVNAGTFGNSKVYLASDIKVNDSVLDANGALVKDTSVLKNWVPIGLGSAFSLGVYDFQGSFDGQGHTISGLYTDLVKNPGSHTTGGWKSYAAGLFGSVYTNTEIKNVKIVDSYFKATDYAGGVVGVLKNGTIDNVYSKATVETSASCAGGIVGGIRSSASEVGIIKNSWFAGTAKGATIVAGICGRIHTSSGRVNNCLNEGTVIATGATAGGIAGEIYTPNSASATIGECFNTGSVTGTSDVGTVIGNSANSASKTAVTNLYALAQGDIQTLGTGQVSNTNALKSIDTATSAYGYAALTQMNGLDYVNTWIVRQSHTPALASWVETDALYALDKSWAGSGTEEDPYIIKTPQELYGLANSVNAGEPYTGKYFELGANITVNSGTASRWDTEAPKYTWIPIGTKTNAFKGNFNSTGDVCQIKGLYATKSASTGYTSWYVGLFGNINGAEIKNIKVSNSYFSGDTYVGTIGNAVSANIDSMYSNAIVNVKKDQGGGIVAYIGGGTIQNCWYDGTITAVGRYLGGIAGIEAGADSINNCLMTGSIYCTNTSGNVYTGGLLGLARSDVRITDCMVAAKDIQSTKTGCYGSVIGSINDGQTGVSYVTTVENVYALDTIGNTTATVGRTSNSGGSISGEPKAYPGVYYKGGNSYMFDLDFESSWVPMQNDVPVLKALVDKNSEIVDVYAWYNGSADGTEANPYIIDEEYELYTLAELVNSGSDNFEGKHIKLQADLTFNQDVNAPVYEWKPIGVRSSDAEHNNAKPFKGSFNVDGDVHVISGLYSKLAQESVGLFGYVDSANIQNIKVVDSYIEGKKYVGTVVGYSRQSIIDTVYVSANVTATTGGRVGGLLGRLEGGSVNNSVFNGAVANSNTEQYVGGLVGQVGWYTGKPAAPIISNCLVKGTVTSGRTSGNAYVGGLLGGGSGLNVTITGSVSIVQSVKTAGATGCVGGFVGGNSNSAVTTTNCYAVTTGKANGTGASGGSYAGEAYKIADSTGASLYMARLDFDTYWVLKETTPELKSFATNAAVFDARSWYDDAEAVDIEGVSYEPGTKENPYVINEAYELCSIAEMVNSGEQSFANKYIVLGKDIVLNSGDSSKWSTSAPAYDFVPIGNSTSVGFQGHFNETSEIREIKGLYINKGTSNFGGIFGSAISATIANIKVADGYVQGGQHIGAVAGYAKNTTIDTVYADVYIRGTHVGTASNGSTNIGGVVGYQVAGTTSKCWAAGTVEGTGDTQYVGGVVGRITDANGAVIDNCLATGKVISGRTKTLSNNAYVGGILGGATKTVTISNCFSAVTQVKTAGATGCVGSVLGGTTVAGVTITNCYASKDSCNGVGLGSGGAGTPSGTPTILEKYTGYQCYKNAALDYINTWVAMEETAPRLRAFAPEEGRFDTDSWYEDAVEDASGNAPGTQANPYIIDTVAEMYGLAERVNEGNTFEGQYIKLDADLTFNTDTDFTKEGYVPEYEWTPIGKRDNDADANTKPFKGSFNVDGDMHEISGLYVKLSKEVVGLFGFIDSANIENIKVVDSYIEGTKYVGTIAGWSRDSIIDSAYANATVTATTGGRAGGIAGRLDGGTINQCWANCAVSVPAATQYAGGIVGQVGKYTAPTNERIISNCLAEGTVYIGQKSGNAYIGGLLGGASSLTVTITNCFSAVESVTTAGATGCVGSFVGGNSSTTVTTNGSYVIEGICSNVNGTGAVGGTYTGTATALAKEAFYDTEAYEYFDSSVWAARVGTLPLPAVFAQTDYSVSAQEGSTYAVDTVLAGSGTEEDPYQISTVAELYGFAILSKKDNFEGKYIELTANIAVNPTTIDKDDANAVYYDWYPIGKASKAFAGTFDGNGHTISGLYKVWDQYDEKIALFADTASTSVIKDFYITNTRFEYNVVKDATRVASVAGRGAGTFDSIYSDASLQSGGYGTGGIIGAVDAGNATITNCWFDGDMTLLVDKSASSVSTFAGGIVGFVAGKELTIEHSAFSGSLVTEGRRIGGLVGSVHNSGDAASTFVSTDNLVTGKVIGNGTETGIIVGRVYSDNDNAQCQATLNNTFGACDYASYDVQVITKSTVTGSAYVSHSKDRFIGFMGENTTLDFGVWTLMSESAPMLKAFVDAGKMDFGTMNTGITSVADVKAIIDPTNAYNFATPVQKGAGEYLFTATGKTAQDFATYCSTLTNFTKVSSNTIENVLNNVYASDDYTLNATFANNTIYVTFSTAQSLSVHLNDANGNKATVDYTQKEGFKDDGYTALSGEIPEVKLHMVEQKYYQANCFIIQLTNGHFIIIDGGMPQHDGIVPAEFMYEYLERLVPPGKKPIVEAWVVSHAHEDHIGIFETIYKDAIATTETTKNYAGRIYVEGIYFNEPNDAVITTYSDGHHRLIAALKMATTKLKTSAGKMPKIYSMLTGQRYTFDAVTMDILEAQEVLSEFSSEGGNEAFNDTSTWTLFTINGKKLLTAGDSSEYGMQFINNTYSKSFLKVDIFTALHHGLNTGRYTSGANFTSNLTVAGAVLYANQYDMTKSSSGHPDAGNLVFTRNETFIGKSTLKGISVDGITRKYLYYGQGTSVLTFGDTITATVLPKNDWVLEN